MLNVDGSQVATTQWVTIDEMTIDCNEGNEERITYFFEAVTNTVNVQVQASVNNINWVTLNTRDMENSDAQEGTIVIPSGGSAIAIISPEDRNGINCGFQYYRVQIQGSAPFGTLNGWADAK